MAAPGNRARLTAVEEIEMTEAIEKLRRDLTILAAMAEGMDEYLRGETLFGKMAGADLPMLTLGGYLLRQHRLYKLRDLLPSEDQAKLQAVMITFNEALVEKVVRFEERAHQELAARIRQVEEYLRDLGNKQASGTNYATAVEPRAMITALTDKLDMAPYHLNPRINQQVELLDKNLRRRWRDGDFVWTDGWQPAYPPESYWWLYGRPT
jgi:hypothetical protein